MERFLAIVNPVAGAGRCGRLAGGALSRLRDAGLQLDVVETVMPVDATRIARQAYKEGRRHFIAVGGDGTAYEIVDGLFPDALQGETPSLGFLPMGTGNSFLRDFTDRGAEFAIEALIRGRKRPCDVIRLTHRSGMLHFINMVSMGFAADVCAVANRVFKPLGPASYAMGVVATVARLKGHDFAIRLDGGRKIERRLTLISFCNSRFTGGAMMMAPEADTADGQLDVVFARQMGRAELLRIFPSIFRGTHIRHRSVEAVRTRYVHFDAEEEAVLVVDGEVLEYTPRRMEVLPGALQVRV
jgi:diacylglycerol kinase (ATP)